MPPVTKDEAAEWVRKVLRGDCVKVTRGHHWVCRDGSGSIRISDATLALIMQKE